MLMELILVLIITIHNFLHLIFKDVKRRLTQEVFKNILEYTGIYWNICYIVKWCAGLGFIRQRRN